VATAFSYVAMSTTSFVHKMPQYMGIAIPTGCLKKQNLHNGNGAGPPSPCLQYYQWRKSRWQCSGHARIYDPAYWVSKTSGTAGII
jgi:hypothetical protein